MEGWRPGFSSSSAINNLCDLQLATPLLSHSLKEEGLSCKRLGSSEILLFCEKIRPQVFCCCRKLFWSAWIWQLNFLKFFFRVLFVRAWDFQVHHSIVDTHKETKSMLRIHFWISLNVTSRIKSRTFLIYFMFSPCSVTDIQVIIQVIIWCMPLSFLP